MKLYPGVHPTAAIGGPPEWDGRAARFPPFIDPTASIGAFVSVDTGGERETRIGVRTVIMKHCHIAHDVQIGDLCDIAPGALIGGMVTIGDNVKIGMGAVIGPYNTIGNGVRIGIGSVVIADVPEYTSWYGNPARKLSDLCRGGCFTTVPKSGDWCTNCFARRPVP